jgi:hypothetical protein
MGRGDRTKKKLPDLESFFLGEKKLLAAFYG